MQEVIGRADKIIVPIMPSSYPCIHCQVVATQTCPYHSCSRSR
jgi:hypothetical protein